MTRIPVRALIAGVMATVVILTAGGIARARAGFDGLWSVTIITDSGNCDRAYRYPLRIADGRIYHADEGDQSFITQMKATSLSIFLDVCSAAVTWSSVSAAVISAPKEADDCRV